MLKGSVVGNRGILNRLTGALLPLALLLTILPARSDTPSPSPVSGAARPGARVVVDAHNCYPYEGRWADRIDRALAAATPIAIEQDLVARQDKSTGAAEPVLSHSRAPSAGDPAFARYFFEALRPRIEAALAADDRSSWPLVTLNLDLKSDQPATLHAIWNVLEKYQDWLTTAPRTADLAAVQPLDVGPILVLTGASDAQQAVFYNQVPVGGKLLVFGAVHDHVQPAGGVPAPDPANNYRRWWNNSWSTIEPGGPWQAGTWTPRKAGRLQTMVQRAHQAGLWIRFYTLDGASEAEMRCHGWMPHYDFGSLAAAEVRWRAAAAAGVDYIASDQYAELAAVLAGQPVPAASDGQAVGSCRNFSVADAARLDLYRWLGVQR